LPRHPQGADLDYFGRQMLAVIAERPGDRTRLARIKHKNEYGLHMLKAHARDLYNEVMAALAGRE
jgi:hypothetical protein